MIRQPNLLQRAANQRCSGRNGLRNQKFAEMTNNMTLGITAGHPPRQALAHHLRKLQHAVAAGQLQNIHRFRVVGGGNDERACSTRIVR